MGIIYKLAIYDNNELNIIKLISYLSKMCTEKNIKLNYEIFRNKEQIHNTHPSEIDFYIFNITNQENLSFLKICSYIRKKNKEAKVIFICSQKNCEYILEGYKVGVYRCLLNPVTYSVIKESVTSCIFKIEKSKNNFILIKFKNCIQKIYINKIHYIKIERNLLIINTASGKYHTYESLDYIERKLYKYNFFRCHKSYLINIFYINQYNKDFLKIESELIPISKYKYNNLKLILQNMLPKFMTKR